MNTLQRLEQFYRMNCNGDWEHQYGVRISTLDNPGWRISISLEGTRAQGKIFPPVVLERSEED